MIMGNENKIKGCWTQMKGEQPIESRHNDADVWLMFQSD